MARVLINESNLQNIADAIRGKNGSWVLVSDPDTVLDTSAQYVWKS